jgi:hypothetical protein
MSLMVSTAVLWSAGAAMADISAPQLWAEWQDMQRDLGTTITAEDEQYAGGVLTLTNVATRSQVDQMESNGRIAQIVLRELADGTVRVELAPVYALSTIDRSSGETTITTMEMRHSGLDILASGDSAERTYDYSAREVILDVGDVTIDGEAIPFETTIAAQELASRYIINVEGAGYPFTSADSLGAMQIRANSSDPSEGTVDLVYELSNLESAFFGSMGDGAGSGVPFGPLSVALQGELTHAGSRLQVAADTPDGDFQMEARTGTGTLAMDISPTQFGVFSDTAEAEMRGIVGGLPLPLEASVGRTTFGLTMPLTRTDGPAPVNLTLGLRDVVMSDVLWGLFDPQGLIPRDPATIALDLEGTATLLSDLTDAPETFGALQGPPAEINSLRINTFEVTVGGAQLLGTGAATFDNAGPIPSPVGRVNLSLTGGFALLDQLAALGLVPPEQVGMVRMMSGMFARPTGPDALASEIEFVEGGGILVNGFPVQ